MKLLADLGKDKMRAPARQRGYICTAGPAVLIIRKDESICPDTEGCELRRSVLPGKMNDYGSKFFVLKIDFISIIRELDICFT